MDALTQGLAGNLSPSQRIWSALLPALILGAYFFASFVAYVIRFRGKGFRDGDLSQRAGLAASPIAHYFLWSINPLWGLVRQSRIPPDAVTTLSLLIAMAAAVAMAAGRFALGGWLFILSAVCDLIDGRLARITGSASPRGAALDSVLDRYSDAAVLSGLAWYYRESWVLIFCLVALAGSLMISYSRAKGEALNADMKGVGRFQRPERVLLLGLTTAFSPILASVIAPGDPHPMHWIAVGGIVVLAVGTQITVAHRLIHLLRVLPGPETAPLPHRRGAVTRAVVSAVVATALDFGFVVFLVHWGVLGPALATGLGCLLGALVNFTLNRMWTFDCRSSALGQGWRYGVVSVSSALMNSGGVGILLMMPDMDYRVAWVLVRLAVFFTWNFPLHRDYVFAHQSTLQERAIR